MDRCNIAEGIDGMKTKRMTLYKKIIIILLVVLTIAIAITDILRYAVFRRECQRHAENITKQSVSQLSYLLKKEEVDACIDNPDSNMAKELKEKLTSICVENGLEYIYIYVPDFEKSTATYYLAVSSNSKVNEEIARTRSAGTVVDLTKDILEVNKNAWNKSGENTVRYENEYGDVATSFAALTDGDESYALIGVDYNSEGITSSAVRGLVIKMVVGLIIFILLFIVITAFIRKKVVKPILYISERMCRFTTDIEERDFNPIEIKTGDEIEIVAEAFNLMATEISSYIEEVKKWATEEAKISTEIDVARRIQYGVVAERMDTIVQENLHISGRMTPARQVGGDFYDSFELPDGSQCVLIGDVSGKGIGAAMFMMYVKAILHEKLMSFQDIALAVSSANDEICSNNPETMFATVFVVVFDNKSNVLKYVNAGHNAPIIINDGKAKTLDIQTGIALGLFEEMDFVLEETEFTVGNTLYIYTDGVTDCVNEKNEFWGMESMLRFFNECEEYLTTQNYCDKIIEELKKYRGKAEAFDDVTMVCIQKNN